MTATESTPPYNPYDPARDPKRYNVTALLLSGNTVSWDDLKSAVGGRLSPRTFAFILRELESRQHVTILKLRDPEYGTLYRYDASVPYDDHYRISRAAGPDGRRHLGQGPGTMESPLEPVPEVNTPSTQDAVSGAPEAPQSVAGDTPAPVPMEASEPLREAPEAAVEAPLDALVKDPSELDALLAGFVDEQTTMAVFEDDEPEPPVTPDAYGEG